MIWLGFIIVIMGITYLIYTIMFRKKVTIYFKSVRIVEGRESKYLNLQLYFSILNSLLFIIIGIIIVVYEIKGPIIIL